MLLTKINIMELQDLQGRLETAYSRPKTNKLIRRAMKNYLKKELEKSGYPANYFRWSKLDSGDFYGLSIDVELHPTEYDYLKDIL